MPNTVRTANDDLKCSAWVKRQKRAEDEAADPGGFGQAHWPPADHDLSRR
jgi:hypothetical protein